MMMMMMMIIINPTSWIFDRCGLSILAIDLAVQYVSCYVKKRIPSMCE